MASKDTSYSSIWLFEKGKELPPLLKDAIAQPIGRQSPTGGQNYSEFNPTICRKVISFWSELGDYIVDPFAGRTRAFMSMLMQREYTGFELSSEVCDYIQQALNTYKQSTLLPVTNIPQVINDDSFNIDNYNLPACDMVFTCPPYWNLETYYAGNGDLSAISNYDDFLVRYKSIMQKAIDLLKPMKFMVVVVGDFRQGGVYIPFHSDNIQVFRDIKEITLHDIIVIQSVTFDIANFRFGGFAKSHIVAKVHEYALVYRKRR